MANKEQKRASPLLLLVLGFTLGVVAALAIFWLLSWHRERKALFDERCNYTCPGPYRSCVGVSDNRILVVVKDISRSGLDSYDEWRPHTGGDRLFIYFDVDPNTMGAEYRLVIYQDEWTFRGPQRNEEGYEIELATGVVKGYGDLDHRGVEVEFDASLIDGEVTSAWNFRM